MALFVAGSMNMDVVAFGERIPVPGETVSGERVGFYPGGKGLNAAVGAVRQGADTKLVARLGHDAFGAQLYAFAQEAGLDLTHTERLAEAQTGTAVIMVSSQGENSIVVIPGANGMLTPEPVRNLDLSASDVLLSVFEIPLGTVKAFLERGRERGARTVLSPAPAKPCDFLDLADYLVMNETELGFYGGFAGEHLTPEEAVEGAQALRGGRNQTLVITLGAEGCVAVTPDTVFRIPGRRVEAVDTTGAGDCFVGSFSARLEAGDDLESALRYATVAASISVTRAGAAPSMPGSAEVLPPQ